MDTFGHITHVVTTYFSLEHNMWVRDAVNKIVEHGLSDMVRELNLSPALITSSTDFSICRSPEFATRFNAVVGGMGQYPSASQMCLSLGMNVFLDSFSRGRLEATARAFGLDASIVSSADRTMLLEFIVAVSFDVTYFAAAAAGEAAANPPIPMEASGMISPPEHNHDAVVDPLTVADSPPPGLKQQQHKKEKRERQLGDKSDVVSKPKKEKKSGNDGGGAEDTVAIKWETIQSLCDQDGRNAPPEHFRTLPLDVSWRLLVEPKKMTPEELRRYRVPIGPTSSLWQLNQWYSVSELVAYCKENYLSTGSDTKKTKLVHVVMRHVAPMYKTPKKEENNNNTTIPPEVTETPPHNMQGTDPSEFVTP
eukprot:PhF_6_TR35008/c0_g1_i1/m.50935